MCLPVYGCMFFAVPIRCSNRCGVRRLAARIRDLNVVLALPAGTQCALVRSQRNESLACRRFSFVSPIHLRDSLEHNLRLLYDAG